MRIDIDVRRPPAALAPREGTHTVRVDATDVCTPERLFDALAEALDFPDYFGRNWAALDECFSDYFVLTDGGLGSRYGGRTGIPAEHVRIVVAHAGGLLRGGSDLVERLAALLRYTREENEGLRAADLLVVIEVDDDEERARFEAALAAV